MKKCFVLMIGLLFGFGMFNVAQAVEDTRFFCTETWSNGAGTFTRQYHCYSPETYSTCMADCQISPGCDRTCCIDENDPIDLE